MDFQISIHSVAHFSDQWLIYLLINFGGLCFFQIPALYFHLQMASKRVDRQAQTEGLRATHVLFGDIPSSESLLHLHRMMQLVRATRSHSTHSAAGHILSFVSLSVFN